MKRLSLLIAVCSLGSVLFAGCSGSRLSAPPASKIGEPSNDERQRQADRKAQQLGQKPAPVDYTRN